MTIFIFDLDGTITKEETLPKIAKHFGIESEIDELTQKTIYGNIPFVESFTTRVDILSKLPIDEVANLMEQVKLYSALHEFIKYNHDICVIATSNLDCWTHKLLKKIGCTYYNSNAEIKNNKIIRLNNILKKENIVEYYQQKGHKVIFIGDGNNDLEAMVKSDISIACGLTHYPASSILSIADYLIFDEYILYNLLHKLL